MKKYLKRNNYKVIATSKYIIAEGELPICLVAHLDTVGQAPPQDIFYDQEKKVMWSPQLLGADDRAGVYAIIQIIEAGYRPHVIFTTDEEAGVIGTQALVTQNPDCPLENLKAIFQLDRNGSDDCVFYRCDNPDFTKYVESFGFKEAQGSFTDISVLAPAWGVAAANLSIGYYLEHSNEEYLKCSELEKTIGKVKKILDNAEDMLSYAYIESPILQNRGQRINALGINGQCAFCGFPLEKEYYSVNECGFTYHICSDCYNLYYKNAPTESNMAPFDF